jgi:3-phenylpropionate/trans-cinnamate dioxygenase ferredoxin reductase component
VADRAVGALIVGAGVAGAACAAALRKGGFEEEVLLVGREPDPPYERPPVSKGYLAGRLDRQACLLHDEAWYAKRSIELATRTSVMRLDTAARTATLSTREVVGYGVALLATGANVRRLRLEGGRLDGVHYLRALGNADALRAAALEAGQVVLAGGSYIACEVAATLTALGRRCTMVMTEAAPMETGFGATVGRFVAELLASRGIALVCSDALERLEGDGRVRRAVCASGRVLDADLVVMGTGAVPEVALARMAGLELGETGGVRCSAALETSAAGVWAAGDTCKYEHAADGRRLRIEHWEVALAQGKHAAAGMLGARRPFEEVPYFWSELADWCTAEYVGTAEAWDREVVRGDPASGAFTVFQLHGGRLAGAVTVGRPTDLMGARRLIAERTDLTGRDGQLAGGDLDAL